ncbi:MAG: SUF system NifU family Fe-S cluster assembly protein [Candidatus Marinimicrobia bacterium]|nr:SUF system NifU family Fe-S cluster assembly protein [Candidatus Neomarinimicrobiota bacterium]
MDVFRDLYQQLIIDHNQNPRNFHELENASHHAEGQNPLCGDALSVYVKEKDGIVEEVSFTGSGCAISKASASIMTSALAGLEVSKATRLFEDFITLATTGEGGAELGKMEVLGGVHKYPARVKCATLAWHTFRGALDNTNEIIKTE